MPLGELDSSLGDALVYYEGPDDFLRRDAAWQDYRQVRALNQSFPRVFSLTNLTGQLRNTDLTSECHCVCGLMCCFYGILAEAVKQNLSP